jgi:hypothetical protein
MANRDFPVAQRVVASHFMARVRVPGADPVLESNDVEARDGASGYPNIAGRAGPSCE